MFVHFQFRLSRSGRVHIHNGDGSIGTLQRSSMRDVLWASVDATIASKNGVYTATIVPRNNCQSHNLRWHQWNVLAKNIESILERVSLQATRSSSSIRWIQLHHHVNIVPSQRAKFYCMNSCPSNCLQRNCRSFSTPFRHKMAYFNLTIYCFIFK